MSLQVTMINAFFKNALKEDVEKAKERIILTERQGRIFDMYYIKGHDINYIADNLFMSPSTINKELKKIREKLIKVL